MSDTIQRAKTRISDALRGVTYLGVDFGSKVDESCAVLVAVREDGSRHVLAHGGPGSRLLEWATARRTSDAQEVTVRLSAEQLAEIVGDGAGPSPASIAEEIEQRPEGRRVRALILRELDGDDQVGSPVEAWERAIVLGLVCEPPTGPSYALTPLGRMVAEACRPAPWTASGSELGWIVDPAGEAVGQVETYALASRVAFLLSADDLADAKRFEEPA